MTTKIIILATIILIPLAARAAVTMNPAIEGNIWDLIERVANYILYVTAFFLAPIMYVLSAVNFITASGDIEKITKAKKLALWTTVGLIMIIISKEFISFLNNSVFG